MIFIIISVVKNVLLTRTKFSDNHEIAIKFAKNIPVGLYHSNWVGFNYLISRCQGYSRVIKVIQFLPVYIFIITR